MAEPSAPTPSAPVTGRAVAGGRRARPRRLTPLALGALATLAVLGSACGSSSDTSATSATSVRRDALADAGAGGGWKDCPEPCSFAPEAQSGETTADAGSAGAGSYAETRDAPTPTTIVGALPTTGADPTSSPEPSGPVTAGSVDDNADWDEYLRYRQEFDATGLAADRVTVEGRQVFTVTDGEGRPVLGASITVRDAGGAEVARLTTYADGRALFHPSTAVDPSSQNRPRYTATVTKGGASQEVTLDAETREYAVRLDGAEQATGIALDVVFLIDTTGSMGDEIDRLKANISSMADKIGDLPGAPDVRFGMTLYRDQGDLFVTRTFDLTGDQAAFAEALDAVQADGGGDTPEDLDAGLRDALDQQSWRGEDAVKLVFLVADAPPHLDDPGSVSYATSALDAAARGIKVLPIGASGLDPQGEYVMRQLAQLTLGRFVFLTYGVGGVGPGDSTPMNVEPDRYSVLPLDELVVQLVADELAPLAR